MKTTWISKKRKKINVRAVRRPFLQLGICFGSQLKKQEQHRSNGTNSLHEKNEMKYVIKTDNKFPLRTQKLCPNKRKPWQAARRTTRFQVLRLMLDECKWTEIFPKNSQTRQNNFFELQNMNYQFIYSSFSGSCSKIGHLINYSQQKKRTRTNIKFNQKRKFCQPDAGTHILETDGKKAIRNILRFALLTSVIIRLFYEPHFGEVRNQVQ